MMPAVGSGGNGGGWTRLAEPAGALVASMRWERLRLLLALAVPARLALKIRRHGSQGAWLYGLAATCAALLTVVLQLDRVLADMHLAGTAGGGMAALGTPGLPEAWAEYARATVLPADPRAIARAFLAIDVLLVVGYTTLLALAAAMLADACEADDRGRRATLAGALLLTPVLMLADLLENLLQWLALDGHGSAAALELFAAAKWVLLLATVLPIALAAIWVVHVDEDGRARGVLRTLAAVRFQVVALLAFAALLLAPVAGPQTADTILRWGVSDSAGVAAIAIALTLLLGVTLFATASSCARADERLARKAIPLGALAFVGALPLAAGAILWVADGQGQGLTVIGGLILATAIVSLPLDVTPHRQVAADRDGVVAVPALLAAGPPLLLALAILAATTGQLALYGFGAQPELARLAVGAAVAVPLTVALFAGAQRRDARPVGVVGTWLAGAVALLIAAAVYRNPWRIAEIVGAVGAVTAFLILFALIGWSLVAIERRWAPPAALTLASFHRLPILLLLLAGLVGAATLDQNGDHVVRTYEDGPPPASDSGGATAADGVSVTEALARWRRSNRGVESEAVPLVFVAASGGGIRAAYWTARVLRCAVEWQGPPDRRCRRTGTPPAHRLGQPLFAASGASGGSLGLASYAARLGASAPPEDDWVFERLGDDYLTPTLAWLLFSDVPKAIAGLHFGQDRAEVLERSWEQSWSGGSDLWDEGPESSGPLHRGLRESWREEPRVPLLLLNGTSVHDDCRVSASVLDADVEDPQDSVTGDCYTQRRFAAPAGPGSPRAGWALPATHDVFDYLSCRGRRNADVRLSTAALLSARFPLVSPSGRLEGCAGEDTIHVVDGGYVDNSGASTAVELWRQLEREVDDHNRRGGKCIVPVFLQIDNDYAREGAAEERRRPYEPFVPLQVFANVRAGNGADARQAAALEFHRERFGPVRRAVTDRGVVHRYAHVYPRAHPGTRAPLGWALSHPSMVSLDRQVGRFAAGGEQDALSTIGEWFDPGLRCERAPSGERRDTR